MTQEETIKVLQSIEDRAVDFPYMTACDWVAIAAAKRHLENSLEVKEVEKPIEIRFECIPVMASTEIGKSEYQIRANVTEDTLQQILKTKIIKML